MIRTSGAGREGWMTAIPLAILFVFVLYVTGGPHDFLRLMERTAEAMLQRITAFVS